MNKLLYQVISIIIVSIMMFIIEGRMLNTFEVFILVFVIDTNVLVG